MYVIITMRRVSAVALLKLVKFVANITFMIIVCEFLLHFNTCVTVSMNMFVLTFDSLYIILYFSTYITIA